MQNLIPIKKDFQNPLFSSLFLLSLAACIYYFIQIIKIPYHFHELPTLSILLFGLTFSYLLILFANSPLISWFIILSSAYLVGSSLSFAYLEIRWLSIHGTLAEFFLTLLWIEAWIISLYSFINNYRHLNKFAKLYQVLVLIFTLFLVCYLGWQSFNIIQPVIF